MRTDTRAAQDFSAFLADVLACSAHTAYVLHMGDAGTAIRKLRTAQHLSLRELARLAKVEASYLSQVERGLREPTDRWLKAVTDALGEHLAGVR